MVIRVNLEVATVLDPDTLGTSLQFKASVLDLFKISMEIALLAHMTLSVSLFCMMLLGCQFPESSSPMVILHRQV
ncbi:hypothetical protein BT63DRAFT_459174 [Microthyrium microscopicum]|uniref:Uncharacterized protein n=1 Tax=Microthyrium microscopicum TaxID=703497 RepID=A0A6A6U0H3_9PEZI|nr:hypothetical protein BT63DRAFT_459174 [Microthyrium microscopicum]